jgi:phospholipid transport system substrate-binding protein
MTPREIMGVAVPANPGFREKLEGPGAKESVMSSLLTRSVIFGLTLNLLVGVAGAWAGPPTEIAKQVIEKALDILQNPAYRGEERRQMVKRVVDPHFDYREMAKRSLGPTWGTLNPAQRQEFVALFAQLLEASYSDKIEKYAQRVKIDYTGEIPDGEYVEVRTVVRRANDRLPLNYRLLNEGGTWKVYDVVIEGVSLVSNYRSQFSRIIHESSYAELVRRLKTKVSELTQTG